MHKFHICPETQKKTAQPRYTLQRQQRYNSTTAAAAQRYNSSGATAPALHALAFVTAAMLSCLRLLEVLTPLEMQS